MIIFLFIILLLSGCSSINHDLVKELNLKYPPGTVFISKKNWGLRNNILIHRNTWKYRSNYDGPLAFHYGDPMIVVKTTEKGMIVKNLSEISYLIQHTNIDNLSDFEEVLSLYVIPKFLTVEKIQDLDYPPIYDIYSAIALMNF